MSLNSRTLTIISVCLLSLASILYTIGNLSPSWSFLDLSITQHGNYIRNGLWKVCWSVKGEKICASISCWGDNGHTTLCQRLSAGYLLIGSSLLTLFTAIYFFLCVLKKEADLHQHIVVAKILVGISCVLGLIGVVMGAISTHQISHVKLLAPSMDAGAFIAISGLIINFVAVITSILIQ